MKGFFVIVITAVAIGWLTAQARRSKARHVDDKWLFPPIAAMQVVFALALVMAFSFLIFGFGGPPQDRFLVVSIGVLFAAFAALNWPKQIEITSSGVRQRTWRGGWKTILWDDVTHSEEKPDGSVVLHGQKEKIVFSPYHAGKQRFLEQLEERCRSRAVG